MAKHLKGRIYKRLLRFICNFPTVVKFFYDSFQFLVVHMPFLRSSYKWKMIRTRVLNFEIQRALYRRGKPSASNILFEVSYAQGDVLADARKRRADTGYFTLDVVVNGLLIKGKVNDLSAEHVNVMVDGLLLRKITLAADREFFTKVQPSVLQSFPPHSVISVQTGSGCLLMYGMAASASLNAPFGTGGLEGLLGEGHLLSKKGGMSTSADTIKEHQEKFLQLYSEVRAVFDKDIGTPLFLTYGTLLGYVRGGDFIPNDDDFDAGYLSRKGTPQEVKKETLEIMLKLLRAGFSIGINAVGRLFKIHRDTDVHLDLMPVWFEGAWNVAYRGACVKASESDFLPAVKGSLRGVEVYAPRNPEIFLEGYYGKNWRVPDPGYVSDYRQTGKNLKGNYGKFLLTPYEYLRLLDKVEAERKTNPDMGTLIASSLNESV